MADLFEGKAKNWDASDRSRILSSGIGACIIKNVALDESMHVLDFGAGTGLIASQVAPYVKKITAVDVSESMLEKLISKLELIDKVEVLCQDITVKPIGIKYDLIMSAMAMHHVQDTDNMIKQLAAHAKLGGKIALADLDAEDGTFHSKGTEGVYHNGFDRNVFEIILKRYGFRDIHFETALTFQGENDSYTIFLALATKG
ncbi:putative AdoMet-dependent methyltransferase [Polynucleobacter sphagniphilus]|uniref:class I SAM-dependent DNA methyltransferase n=1 Tax=Polynucleobacter sphagniphilus TaxID=1743169 RepID=UPI0024769DB6|nr:class I SAM-dependent methyltransferase [Polynucleobacter sphagniphilus]MDH6422023.1 putative AdoMet-dependent methyltransferase [Polynucleobacter sphagniphilus]